MTGVAEDGQSVRITEIYDCASAIILSVEYFGFLDEFETSKDL